MQIPSSSQFLRASRLSGHRKPLLKLLTLLLSGIALHAETRRALVVGIDDYQPHPPAAAKTGRDGRNWVNLKGAVADARLFRQVLIDRYGFHPEEIVFLSDRASAKTEDEVATRELILQSFQHHLIDAAAQGDRAVFYFAGHGSRVRNSKSTEPGGMDQSLVPADSFSGAPDIRDKELVRLYRKAVQKGVSLTVIADSCHSGGIIRGAAPRARARALEDDPRDAADPPDLDMATGKPLPNPTTQGVLVIAAALDTEAAEEVEFDGETHGVFTKFFTSAILSGPVNEPVSRLFSRADALIRNSGYTQQPVMAGEGRFGLGLFGGLSDAGGGLTVAVQEVRSSGTVVLRGGLALGLVDGCELVNVSGPESRIQIEGHTALAYATAKLIAGSRPKPGDLFRADRWVFSAGLATRYYLPSLELPSRVQLQDIAQKTEVLARKRGIRLIDDPTVTTPGNVLRFADGRWELESRKAGGVSLVHLGSSPDLRAIEHAITGENRSLFVDFPPPAELVTAIRHQTARSMDAVEFVEGRSGAIYHIVGASRGGQLRYGWVLASATGADAEMMPIPVRTDFAGLNDPGCAERILQSALNIARLRLWLNLAVPDGGSAAFPYSLALRDERTKAITTSGDWFEGVAYSLILKATAEPVSIGVPIMPRYVYLMAIDRSGEMKRLVPTEENSSANRVPRETDPPGDIVLYRPEVSAPFGIDTLILLTSEEPVDTAALSIDPVLHDAAGASRGAAPQSLSRFLFQIQRGSRGGSATAPVNWSMDRITLRSLPRSALQGVGK